MQKSRFLIRLDDACPYMDRAKWQRMEDILDKHGLKPLVGIIPANADPQTMIDIEDHLFWDKAHDWETKGWSFALHGYDHCYRSNKGMYGLNPMWSRSEFAGISLEKQREKIKNGYMIMKEHNLYPKYFFAPSHTFDENTLIALLEESDIRIISDTIGRYPYKKGEFWFIPQITGHCTKMPLNGIFTFCFHPNTMDDDAFKRFEDFLESNKNDFICFDQIDLMKYGKKKTIDKMLSQLFFTYRKVRGLR